MQSAVVEHAETGKTNPPNPKLSIPNIAPFVVSYSPASAVTNAAAVNPTNRSCTAS